MKLIIAGGRNYQLTTYGALALNEIYATHAVNEVVSGGAKGADAWGERWARSLNISIKRFPADWDKHGRAAGPIRNAEMAEHANALAIFPGGRGTASMLSLAAKHGLTVFDLR